MQYYRKPTIENYLAMTENFNHIEIEKKWQKIWDDSQLYKTDEISDKEKYYVLEMFLYPSGNIHMGHVRNYAIGDAIARYKKAQGLNVLHPMGWDAFGLPAENAAIQNKLHPNDWTIKNIAGMKVQLNSLGFSYDWSREINTSQPDYYKHEQAMFIDFLEKGLAYQKESIINWDPVDCTVLANEQVVDGKGWRSGAKIQKKKLNQWFLKITKYADEMLHDLDTLANWPNKVKIMQKNWIGKSSGAEINFKVHNLNEHILVFSTRPETIFGATFICISHDHEFVKNIPDSDKKSQFINKCKLDSESGAIDECIEKEGFLTEYYVDHPYIKNKKLPIFIANYVISDYGTGAVFGCPAHDERDYEFATKYDLEILQVLANTKNAKTPLPYTDIVGKIINSDFLDDLSTEEAKIKILEKLKADKIGTTKITFRLKDWGISRQRYWGCPIPIIYCKNCGTIPELKEHLPIELPQDISFENTGNPLDNHPTWKNTKCHKCGSPAIRETDTFDTFFESSWYFARFCSLEKQVAFNKTITEKWLPVNQYIGGIEHAILHLLYARFFTKALRDCQYFDINEPFKGLLTQGMICHKTFKDSNNNWLSPDQVIKKADKWIIKNSNEIALDGRIEKMSKSKKNTIDPSTMIKKFGADSIRLFLLSDSPPTRDLEWSDEGIEGSHKYLNSLYKFVKNFINNKKDGSNINDTNENKFKKFLHQTIHSVTLNIENFTFNKAIAEMRKLTNELFSHNYSNTLTEESLIALIKMLSIFTPHIAEELYLMLGKNTSIYLESWPVANQNLLSNESAKVAIQINGKTRTIIELPIDCEKEEALIKVKSIKTLDKYLFNVNIKKLVYIKNKIINFVV